MKSKLCLALVVLFAFIPTVAFATDTKTAELSGETSARIADNCSSIRQNLKNLQRADSRARTYFGAIYETVSSKFLKPLNLRLVNNDLSNPNLSKLQSSFATERTNFSDDFVDYSKSLEDLIAIDCRLEPKQFYEKLLETREKRTSVAEDLKLWNSLMLDSVGHVKKLKESLK